jgi:hypothetical protein
MEYFLLIHFLPLLNYIILRFFSSFFGSFLINILRINIFLAFFLSFVMCTSLEFEKESFLNVTNEEIKVFEDGHKIWFYSDNADISRITEIMAIAGTVVLRITRSLLIITTCSLITSLSIMKNNILDLKTTMKLLNIFLISFICLFFSTFIIFNVTWVFQYWI